jgi:MFS family permease
MGRFFGSGSAGQLVGTFFGGVAAGTIGYSAGFLVGAGLCAASMLTVVFMPDLPRKAVMSLRAILAPVPRAFRSRVTILPAIMGFGTSIIAALVSSVLQAFFVDEGYSEQTIGTLRALHSLGAVISGFAFGVMLARMGQRLMYATVLVGNGAFLALLVVTGDGFWATLLVMFVLGMVFNGGRVLYAGMTADLSTPEQRGVFMAVLGIYWAAAQLIGPAVFGVIGIIFSIEAALVAAGTAVLAAGLLTPLLYRLFASPSEKAPA